MRCSGGERGYRTPPVTAFESDGFPHAAGGTLSTCCRQQWAGNQQSRKSTCGSAQEVPGKNT
ncbi:hypothetical protein NST99_05395 [Paenibacillus sp. FSL L8-0470]|uniref:hypothetical protein n=1 Tax=Paenibacillus sp. FSL L8-0470 TaxID=2954688 RepID=UPI0030FB5C4D